MADTVKQLNSARDICLQDVAIYSQVVPGILPVIAPTSALPVRRWGADFLAETFASPVLNGEEKQKLVVSTTLLDTLRGYINRREEVGEVEDNSVVKAAVQCAASVYPLVFRHSVSNASDSDTWAKMATIKSSILRNMDSWPAGVRMCCMKFLAIVVQVQTPGLIADPRRPKQSEISLALLPRDHPIMKVGNLEAEASGLLDRLLSILQEDGTAALLVTATINSLAPLVYRRASISNKIVNAIISYNPLQLAHRLSVGKNRVFVKSMTRTTISFLMNILKRNPQHLLADRMKNQINRLRFGLDEAFSDVNHLKRSAPDEPIDGLDDAKRQRIDNIVDQQSAVTIPSLPDGLVSVAQLFTLPGDNAASTFDVTAIPSQIVAQLVPALMATIDTKRLDWAINAIRGRYLQVTSRPRQDPDDEYDPSAAFGEEAERVVNELDMIPAQNNVDHHITIGPFKLPPPPPLSQNDAQELCLAKCMRLFEVLKDRDREEKEAKDKGIKALEQAKGWNAVPPDVSTRDGWLRLLIRMATRFSTMLQDEKHIKLENGDLMHNQAHSTFSFADQIRQSLFIYVMEDFRRRINDAIRWFNEEWFAERSATKQNDGNEEDTNADPTPTYSLWTLKFLDGIVPYLDIKDNRTLIRFFSEIPKLDGRHLSQLIKIAEDPERVHIAVQTMLYLVMYRPPVRELALDALERLWKENEDAKRSAEKYLVKWRPHVVEAVAAPEVKAEA